MIHKLIFSRITLSVLLIFAFAAADSNAQPGKRFDGVNIKVGVQNVSAIGMPAKKHAETWEKNTGGSIKVLQYPFIELFGHFMNSISSTKPLYDVILYPSAWTGDFFPYLSEIPKDLLNDESFDDIMPVYHERLMKWNGKYISITLDGDLFTGFYRKDLFENLENRLEFKRKYGYDLDAPHTWQQYYDIAGFFTGRFGLEGKKIYGTSEPFARGGQQFWDVFSRAAAYTNHPDYPGSQFFDPDTMKAQINNPGWIHAVEEYLDILKFCPPGSESFDIVKVRDAFVKGQTAMALDWGDTAQISEDPDRSLIKDRVGYFALPGSHKVWNYKTGSWDKMESVRKVPFLAFGGWVAGVPENSPDKAAAWDYIMWYASPENSLKDVVTGGTGINPYRFSHFTNIDAWTRVFSIRAASEYLDVLQHSLESHDAALDLRIPGFHNYTEILEIQLSSAINKKIPVKEALDTVAAHWEQITNELGREKQRSIYRASMGLPLYKSPGKDKKSFVIGFSQVTTTEPWRILFNREVRKEASKHPEIKLISRDAGDSIETQVKDVEEFIKTGVDAILISPKVAGALTQVVNRAYDFGIPVFVLDRDLENDRYTQYIGGDNKLIGRKAGEYAVERLGGKGKAKGNIFEIWGGIKSTPAQDRHSGFFEIIEKEPGIRILNQAADGDWKQDNAYEIFAQALEKYPCIDLVYAHNDPMAFGAYLAAKDARRLDNTAFIGIDGIPVEGVKWVHEGILTATFFYDPPGDEGIKQALKYLKGETVKKRIILPTMTIDINNAGKILRENDIIP